MNHLCTDYELCPACLLCEGCCLGHGECPSCGSGPLERGYVPGRTGEPVNCSDDWHDPEARDV